MADGSVRFVTEASPATWFAAQTRTPATPWLGLEQLTSLWTLTFPTRAIDTWSHLGQAGEVLPRVLRYLKPYGSWPRYP